MWAYLGCCDWIIVCCGFNLKIFYKYIISIGNFNDITMFDCLTRTIVSWLFFSKYYFYRYHYQNIKPPKLFRQLASNHFIALLKNFAKQFRVCWVFNELCRVSTALLVLFRFIFFQWSRWHVGRFQVNISEQFFSCDFCIEFKYWFLTVNKNSKFACFIYA